MRVNSHGVVDRAGVAWISKAKDERWLDSAFSLTYVFHEQLDDGDFGIALATGHDDRRGAVAELDDNILGSILTWTVFPCSSTPAAARSSRRRCCQCAADWFVGLHKEIMRPPRALATALELYIAGAMVMLSQQCGGGSLRRS
jgi:hypothetical protein